MVVDEEHKFGVQDKEKIKSMKKTVDVLAMSATPIPRSLNMALSSIRSICIKRNLKQYFHEKKLELLTGNFREMS